ncbi:MAG: hypothetical protein ACM3XN_09535 [Chloroflexota bacterium]
MWPRLSSAARSTLAVLATGLAIKLMDDIFDGEETTVAGLSTAGATIYAMVALAIGVALAPAVGLPLFAAAYAVGMAGDPQETLPSGMPAWVESALALAVAAAISGIAAMAHALLVVAAVQLVDDVLDFQADSAIPERNLAHRFGRGEAALAAIICAVLATAFGWGLPAAAGLAYALVRALELRHTGRAGRCCS